MGEVIEDEIRERIEERGRRYRKGMGYGMVEGIG